jgi:hypothetical protein
VAAKGPYEAVIQAEILRWLRSNLPGAVIHHSPNEGRRGWKSQSAIKTQGTIAGWPDLEIFFEGEVLFIEVKREGEYLRQSQKDCHALLRAQGFPVETCRCVEDVEETIRQHQPQWLDWI